MDGHEQAPEQACVILAAPHTSIWDFAIGFFYYRACGGHLHVMIKKESFFFPVKYILKSMGGFPIDRGNGQATVLGLVHAIDGAKARGEKFHLVICPEGTRKPVHKWKTGYHKIATMAHVPVYLAYFDFGTKHVGLGKKFELTGDPRKDTDAIQAEYEKMNLTGLHPEGFTCK